MLVPVGLSCITICGRLASNCSPIITKSKTAEHRRNDYTANLLTLPTRGLTPPTASHPDKHPVVMKKVKSCWEREESHRSSSSPMQTN